MTITREMTVGDVLKANPKTADVFRSMGMHCLGCPSATGESIAGAARTHGLPEEELLKKLNAVEQGDMSDDTRNLAQPRGAVLQRDKTTYAIVPHMPGGITNSATLRKIADVADKFNAAALKCTSAQRIAIVGLKHEDVEKAWDELEMEPAAAVGLCIRSIKICPATTFCKRGQQDAVGLGLELDKRYHGMELPSKFKMAVSGCQNSCSEPAVRDIGIMGTPKGYVVMVGGNAGLKPRLGDKIAAQLEPDEVLELVDKIINWYRENGKRNERVGELIDRVGLEKFRQDVLGSAQPVRAEV
ncbi:MAG: sulfite reductase [Firmicutes bacterium HGW-Firmicutes-14]|nr:MAG: sulfite reductase [Firmicutes bacterium HGW-Firmicutes-14]